ncbi:hypothetical protein PoB_005230700 [Plakobranchus ocellatus]|uniref:Uncharacterized protein n=1 Tax=Plakobranchus ocellatus TaxID=259542 RepID=A0AAV4C3I3_9GAST|nr:hypothetical protein PoB_005230700 [Plakobranchus ocellatus]
MKRLKADVVEIDREQPNPWAIGNGSNNSLMGLTENRFEWRNVINNVYSSSAGHQKKKEDNQQVLDLGHIFIIANLSYRKSYEMK